MHDERSPNSSRNSVSTKPEHARIEQADQIEALASSVRFAIVQVVINTGGASIREIAEQLGRKPSSLYRHVEQLVSAGLLHQAGTQATSRREAVVYEFPARGLRIVLNHDDPAVTESVKKHLSAELRAAERELHKTVDEGTASNTPERWNFGFRTQLGWLNPAQCARVRELFEELDSLFKSSNRKEGSDLMAMTIAVRKATRKDE